jgi:hypothetical protein
VITELSKDINNYYTGIGYWEENSYQQFFALVIEAIGHAVFSRKVSMFSDYAAFENDDSEFVEAYEQHILFKNQNRIASVYIMLLNFAAHVGIDIEECEEVEISDVQVENHSNMINCLSYRVGKISQHESKQKIEPAYISRHVKIAITIIEHYCEKSGIKLEWHVVNTLAYIRQKEFQREVQNG